jgi:hypothetical protein
MVINEALKKQLVRYQRNEISEYHIYHRLAVRLKGSANARDLSFKMRFLEMTGLSFGVAGISFLVGLALRTFMGVEA